MQSWFIASGADAVALELRDVARPAPSARQVLVRVRAVGLNRGEFVAGHGLHATAGARAAGFECSGEVAEVGRDTVDLAVGDRVFGRCDGALSEYACMSAGEAFRLPEGMSWEEAAGVPVVFSTAHDMLMAGPRIAAGQWLLICGAASGVGVASMGLAHACGAKVIGTSGSPGKLARLKELGLDVGVLTRSAEFAAAVAEATQGRGVDWVVDAIGGSVFPACIDALAYEGKLAIAGYVDGDLSPTLDLLAVHKKRLHVFGVSQKLRSMQQREEAASALARDVLPLIENGHLRPVVDRVFTFADLPAARLHVLEDRHVGKIIIRVG